MTSLRLRILAQTLPFLLLVPGLATAQTPPSRAEAAAALHHPAGPAVSRYTRRQIDQMVAPIALYPDQLLGQLLMAATYPQQVVEAAEWVKDPSHAGLSGDALMAALEPLPWDPSVKALAAVPQLLEMMVQHIEWTESLGVAFATQQPEVMARIQALRHLAWKSGHLRKVHHLAVRQEGPVIVITSAEPERIYVPIYNPTLVYGGWPDHGAPPVFLPPPPGFVAETIVPGLEISTGYAVVAPLWGWSRPDWGSDRIIVDRREYTRITRDVEIGPGDTWRHQGTVVLVPPSEVRRTVTTTTTQVPVPAGTVAPAQAAAVTALPQRAAADPRVKMQNQAQTGPQGAAGQAPAGQAQGTPGPAAARPEQPLPPTAAGQQAPAHPPTAAEHQPPAHPPTAAEHQPPGHPPTAAEHRAPPHPAAPPAMQAQHPPAPQQMPQPSHPPTAAHQAPPHPAPPAMQAQHPPAPPQMPHPPAMQAQHPPGPQPQPHPPGPPQHASGPVPGHGSSGPPPGHPASPAAQKHEQPGPHPPGQPGDEKKH
ncbi:MAG: DUF3300 domain-containing protein [Thiohalocapsa sp.]